MCVTTEPVLSSCHTGRPLELSPLGATPSKGFVDGIVALAGPREG